MPRCTFCAREDGQAVYGKKATTVLVLAFAVAGVGLVLACERCADYARHWKMEGHHR